MLAEVRGRLPRAARGARARGRLGRVRSPTGDGVGDERARRARGGAPVRRPDQHPVHVGHDRLPQGRDALAPQHPQQRATSSARALRYTEHDRVVRPGPVLPLLRHGARQPRLRDATARASSCPARRSTRSRCWRPSRPSAAPRCTACRRCSSPSSSTRASREFDLSSLRTGMMGGAPCPVEVMKQVRTRMHMGEVTIVCGMTETSPVSTQTARRRPAGEARRDRRPRPPARRDQDHRPGDRRGRPARDAGRAVHPRLQRDARLLGRRGGDRRGDRRGRLDAHRRPGRHGRRRLRARSSAGSRT